MSKGILEFSLPEEQEAFDNAVNSGKMDSAMYEFDNWLRSKIKYGDLSEEQATIYQEVRNKFWEFKNGD